MELFKSIAILSLPAFTFVIGISSLYDLNGSPVIGSIFITRAPRSDRIELAKGPAMTDAISTIVMSLNGRLVVFFFFCCIDVLDLNFFKVFFLC